MNKELRQTFLVGAWTVEPSLNRISHGEKQVTLPLKVMNVLIYLSHNNGKVIGPDELLDTVWEGNLVTDSSIYHCINQLREALGDDKNSPEYIETISKRGYRLIADVKFESWNSSGTLTQKSEYIIKSLGSNILYISSLAFIFLALLGYLIMSDTFDRSLTPTDYSIAVLPFTNQCEVCDEEYLVDGITEELLKNLARNKALKVAARTSSFYFKDSELTAQQIGNTLGVNYLVEGNIRTNGNLIRLSVQLVEGSNGFQIWSDTFEREMGDLFALEDEISNNIVSAVYDELGINSEFNHERVERLGTGNPQAHIEYLLGVYNYYKVAPEYLLQSINHFKNSIQEDPDFAAPYAFIANAYGLLSTHIYLSPEEALILAEPYAVRAFELDPNLAEANTALHTLEHLKGERDPEMQFLTRAIELNPSYSEGRNWKAVNLDSWHRYQEAWALSLENEQIDPLSVFHMRNMVIWYFEMGQMDEAFSVTERIKGYDRNDGILWEAELLFDWGNRRKATELIMMLLSKRDFSQDEKVNLLDFYYSRVGLGSEINLSEKNIFESMDFGRRLGIWEWSAAYTKDKLLSGNNLRVLNHMRAEALYFMRDYNGAIESYERAFKSDDQLAFEHQYVNKAVYLYYADALRRTGADDRANFVFEQARLSLDGKTAAGYDNPLYYLQKGLTHLYQKELELGFQALKMAVEMGSIDTILLSAPFLDYLRDDARFIDIKDRMSLAKENAKKILVNSLCDPSFGGELWHPKPETCAENEF